MCELSYKKSRQCVLNHCCIYQRFFYRFLSPTSKSITTSYRTFALWLPTSELIPHFWHLYVQVYHLLSLTAHATVQCIAPIPTTGHYLAHGQCWLFLRLCNLPPCAISPAGRPGLDSVCAQVSSHGYKYQHILIAAAIKRHNLLCYPASVSSSIILFLTMYGDIEFKAWAEAT